MYAKNAISFVLGDRPSAFCLRFLLLLPVFTLLTLGGWFKTIVEEPLILTNAWLTFWFLDLMGAQVTLNGAFIYSREFSIEVVSGCTGLFVFLFLFAAVLAFPSPWKSRGKAILLGGTLIFVLNQVRLLTLYFIGTSFPSLFDDMHIYVWQGVIIVFVAFYWYSWAVGSQRSSPAGELPETCRRADGQLPAPDLRLFLRLILALALALITWYGLRYPYSHVVTSAGAKVLSWSSGMPADEIVRVREGKFYLDTGLLDENGRPKPFVGLSVNQVHWNSVILLSLVYMVPWRLWRRCWKYCLVAFLILALSHVTFFTLTVLGEVASRHRAAGIDLFSDGMIKAIAISVQTYSLIFEKALPFLLFIPIVMAWRRPPARDTASVEEKVGRNDRCPCGSGKKYKHCCLRLSACRNKKRGR